MSLGGGKFAHGFWSAGIQEFLTPYIATLTSFGNAEHLQVSGYNVFEATLAGLVSGTVSDRTGGSFANGFVSGFYQNIFNNQGERRELQAAMDHGKALTQKALDTLASVKAGDAEALAQYEEWFGKYSDKNYNKVLKTYQRIQKQFNKGFSVRVTYKDGQYAEVARGGFDSTVELGKDYFSAGETGFNSKGGTLLHELSHRAGPFAYGTKDYAYGLLGSRSLATKNTWKAVRNADTYEYFAESL